MEGSTTRVTLKTAVLGTLAAVVIRVLYATLRWKRINLDPSDPAWQGDEQKLVAFWHGRMLMLVGNYKRARGRSRRPGYVLISRHGDGRLIAFAIKLLGLDSIAGSSSRGGLQALFELARRAKDGADVGITPDGPRGPKQVCKRGIVALGQRTGLPIYPLTYSAKRRWQLSSWDGMILPKPFSPAVAMLGEPIRVGPDEDLESARKRLEGALNELTERADRYWSSQ
jgi:hypothetical protein